jgi:hypothetical protein
VPTGTLQNGTGYNPAPAGDNVALGFLEVSYIFFKMISYLCTHFYNQDERIIYK